MSVIAFIPARAGSKSIPLKNIRLFCSKPLLYWTASAANDAVNVDKVIIATDGDNIRSTAISFGLPKLEVYMRSSENARDDSSTESVMLEYLNQSSLNHNDVFILVQATSPLTTAKNIDEALRLYEERKVDSLLSCSRTKRFLWNNEGRPINYDFLSRPRRQDFSGTFMENGALYISTVGRILSSQCRISGNIAIYEMPEYCGIELDEPSDWYIAESLMKKYILPRKISSIKLLAMDVDGVLTDGGMYYSSNGEALKRFNTIDGKGIELVRNTGIKTALLTSENTEIVSRRAEKLKIDFVRQNVKDKLSEAERICSQMNISLSEIAYIGDDLNDLELLSRAGLSACPLDAADELKSLPGILQLKKSGGHGAVREFCNYILSGCV